MRTIRFTFLCTPEERQVLAELAERLHRSQGDAIRQLIREAMYSFGQLLPKIQPPPDPQNTKEVNM